MSINKAIVVGNLGRDPEVRALPSGQNVANFSIATTARFKDRSGELQKQTEWHRVVAFGKLADNCQQFLNKGRQVYIEGRLQTSSWDDKETGQKKYKTEIVANELVLLGARGEGTEGGSGGYSRGAAAGGNNYDQSQHEEPAHATQIQDEDIPF